MTLYGSDVGGVEGMTIVGEPGNRKQNGIVGSLRITTEFLNADLEVTQSDKGVLVAGKIRELGVRLSFVNAGPKNSIVGYYRSQQFGVLDIEGKVTEYDQKNLPKTIDITFSNSTNKFHFIQTTTCENGIITGHEAKRLLN